MKFWNDNGTTRTMCFKPYDLEQESKADANGVLSYDEIRKEISALNEKMDNLLNSANIVANNQKRKEINL